MLRIIERLAHGQRAAGGSGRCLPQPTGSCSSWQGAGVSQSPTPASHNSPQAARRAGSWRALGRHAKRVRAHDVDDGAPAGQRVAVAAGLQALRHRLEQLLRLLRAARTARLSQRGVYSARASMSAGTCRHCQAGPNSLPLLRYTCMLRGMQVASCASGLTHHGCLHPVSSHLSYLNTHARRAPCPAATWTRTCRRASRARCRRP